VSCQDRYYESCTFCGTVIVKSYAYHIDGVIYSYCSNACGIEHLRRFKGLKLLAEAKL
jgi:hypothetical protein